MGTLVPLCLSILVCSAPSCYLSSSHSLCLSLIMSPVSLFPLCLFSSLLSHTRCVFIYLPFFSLSLYHFHYLSTKAKSKNYATCWTYYYVTKISILCCLSSPTKVTKGEGGRIQMYNISLSDLIVEVKRSEGTWSWAWQVSGTWNFLGKV